MHFVLANSPVFHPPESGAIYSLIMPFLGIVAVGMTFVILSGGIDLSVGSVIAFTGVLLAKLIGTYGIHPAYAFVIVLFMGAMFWGIDGLDY